MMGHPVRSPTIRYDLDFVQTTNLLGGISKVERHLLQGGLSPRHIATLIHLDADDAHLRKAAFCPYERERARLIIENSFQVPPHSNLGPWFGTVGDPKLRLSPSDIANFSPSLVLRRWRTAVSVLKAQSPDMVGFCMVELQLCQLLPEGGAEQGNFFLEPHFHFVVSGVTKAQLKSAFKVRASAYPGRKRTTKIQPVYDLPRLIGYLTKVRPDLRKQHINAEGKVRWARSRMPNDHRASWYLAMSQFKLSELLTSTGIILRSVGKAGIAELATWPAGYAPKRQGSPKRR